jgi:hypothetical protein
MADLVVTCRSMLCFNSPERNGFCAIHQRPEPRRMPKDGPWDYSEPDDEPEPPDEWFIERDAFDAYADAEAETRDEGGSLNPYAEMSEEELERAFIADTGLPLPEELSLRRERTSDWQRLLEERKYDEEYDG